MKPIKNIIFDYGAVIFDIDHGLTIQAFRDLGVRDIDTLFGHLQQHALFDEFEKGSITSEVFRNGIRKLAGIDFPDPDIDRAWNAMLLGIPDENFDLLLRARESYRTFLLSNTNEIHYQGVLGHLKDVHGLGSMAAYFEKDYYSHYMRMRKPDKEIFEFVLEEHGLRPEETLFIDDSPQHIRTAQSLGIQTYLMGKGESLKGFFEKSRLLNS